MKDTVIPPEPTLLFYDASTRREPPLVRRAYEKIFVFSSPASKHNYADFYESCNSFVLHMSTWSWEEIERTARHMDILKSAEEHFDKDMFFKQCHLKF